MVTPCEAAGVATVFEFKVADAFEGEEALEDVAKFTLDHIERRALDTELEGRGSSRERIRRFGVAFKGKCVLVEWSKRRTCDHRTT